ncbi:MAG: hypothetical protein LBM38_03485 [Clostridiales bacterium]|jgi:hypothetical protein|nr:hypothetical protein [Clostridiales bacterium]
MKMNGILSTIMDNYLCLRGLATIKELAEISEVNPDIQRDLLGEHANEMINFLTKGDYKYFPEVVLSMSFNLDENIQPFEMLLEAVNSREKGSRATNIGDITVNFNKQNNKLVGDNKPLKIAQLDFEEDKVKILRIDGNHRLSAADYANPDMLIPFCIILFPTNTELERHSRAIFHNINSKQIPLELELNIKTIIEGFNTFSDDNLLEDPSFGLCYKFTRDILIGDRKVNFDVFPKIKEFIYEKRYSFFLNLFRRLLDIEKLAPENAVQTIKETLVDIENVIRENGIVAKSNNVYIIESLVYYKIVNWEKYSHFIKWIAKNHISEATNLKTDDIISIYDKIYENAPKKMFIARWYPTSEPELSQANHRINQMKEIANELNLVPIDMGTEEGGTFDIRSVMYREISDCDIFVADLTGARHNVMVEVGYALKNVGLGKMVFYYQPKEENDKPPFDLNGFKCHKIGDSRDLSGGVKSDIEKILNESKES